jgi:rRNA maturation RNase YbeY
MRSRRALKATASWRLGEEAQHEHRPASRGVSIQVFNRQSTRIIKLPLLRQITRCLLDALPPPPRSGVAAKATSITGKLAIHLIGAPEMACLNEEFLNHAGSTDVITFNYQEDHGEGADVLCGEIFISVDDAIAAAARFGVAWPLELVRYLAHGLLHLRGFDDHAPSARRKMKTWESRLLKKCRGQLLKFQSF